MLRLRLLIVLLLLLLLGRFIFVAFHVHPHADDWSYAVSTLKDPSIERVLRDYHSWNGRWVSNFVVFKNPMILGLEQGIPIYRAIAIGMIFLLWIALFGLWKILVPDRTRSLIASLITLLTYLLVMPDLHEGIYWYTGAVTYHLPNVLMIVLLISWLKWDRDQRKWRLPINALLTVIIAGSSEVHMVLMLAAYTIWFYPAGRSGASKVPAAFLIIAIVAAIIMIAAPGNGARSIFYPEKHQLLHSLWYGSLQTGRFLFTWIFHPIVLAASILWLMFDRRYLITDRFPVRPFHIAIILLSVIFVLMVMPYWATGILGQHRTVNVAFFVFLFLWPFLLGQLDRVVKRIHFRWIDDHWRVVLGAWLIGGLLLGTGRKMTLDIINGDLSRFDREMREHYTSISAHLQDDVPAMSPIPRSPSSLHRFDPGTDPHHWANRGLVEYLRIMETR